MSCRLGRSQQRKARQNLDTSWDGCRQSDKAVGVRRKVVEKLIEAFELVAQVHIVAIKNAAWRTQAVCAR